MKIFLSKIVILISLLGILPAFAEKHVPTAEELIQLETIGGISVSPDGKYVLYQKSRNDFDKDLNLSQLWLYDISSENHIQLTYGEKSVGGFGWAQNSERIIFARDSKVMVMHRSGGEARSLDIKQKNVSGMIFSDDGKTVSFVGSPEEDKVKDRRKDHMGDFEVIKADGGHRHIYIVKLTDDLELDGDVTAVTSGTDFSVSGYDMSADGSQVVFTATKRPDLASSFSVKLYFANTDGSDLKILDDSEKLKRSPVFSPDDKTIAYSISSGFAYNGIIHTISADGGEPKAITESFDESISPAAWTDEGIYFTASQKTNRHIFLLNPKSSEIKRVVTSDDLIVGRQSTSKSGKVIAFAAANDEQLSEIYVQNGGAAKKITTQSDQLSDFIMAKREVISWQADDGATIEGVLTTPVDFDLSNKYPLFVITHGGPTGTDRPVIPTGMYPIDNWAGQGAVILQTNYRGSAGYGEAFRRLNWRNLGMGPATDIISGINSLVGKGFIDEAKIGCLGWSQGGHISAMLATYSDRCSVAHMGAGISNWATYYYNTDITPFTVQYFGDTPIDDPEVYAKTSPMTYIKNAKTPVLIQHGEKDNRVPIANAYELRQALTDMNVENHMIVYKGMPHGPRRPKTLRAVLTHLDAWFGHYLFGSPKPEFATVGIPEEEDEEEDVDG
ncbi:MAG: S9 family peptidase [Kordiimonadaceae bacterium]|jgi:dipeptidyl aminopeptidase/acylaminoacyl peptidase|nr:S9 family peptidase [Kordiimonadaceae bacterium]MBT7582559.1 S9 family peptidase [Kordiimonadaceae bacterium]